MSATDPFSRFQHRADKRRPWVDAVHIHNALTANHFVDLLDLHAVSHHLPRDYPPSYAHRLRALSTEFRRQVLGALARAAVSASIPITRIPPPTFRHNRRHDDDDQDDDEEEDESHIATNDALRLRHPFILNAVLAHQSARIFARVPALLRNDIAADLFQMPQLSEISQPYLAIVIKRRPLHLDRLGGLQPRTMSRALPEVSLWCSLLSHVLQTPVKDAILVGIHPDNRRHVVEGGNATQGLPYDPAIWKCAPISLTHHTEDGKHAWNALTWRINVVDHSDTWLSSACKRTGRVSEEGLHALASLAEDGRTRPNMKVAALYDWPWGSAKRLIAEGIGELTLVSGISNDVALTALSRGIKNNIEDSGTTACALGISNRFTEGALEMCKKDYKGAAVIPLTIGHNRNNWRMLKDFDERRGGGFEAQGVKMEAWDTRAFFVDFELASPHGLFAKRGECKEDGLEELEELRGDVDVEVGSGVGDAIEDAVIFMIGCGQVVDGKWTYESFVAPRVNQEGEESVIRAWLEHMRDKCVVSQRETGGVKFVYVWGPEQQLLRKALQRMAERNRKEVRNLVKHRMVNVLQVVTSGGVVIRHGLSLSLKAVARALRNCGRLPRVDGGPGECEEVQSGLDVVAVVLEAMEQAEKEGLRSMTEVDAMDGVVAYNEVDCADLARIWLYLTQHH